MGRTRKAGTALCTTARALPPSRTLSIRAGGRIGLCHRRHLAIQRPVACRRILYGHEQLCTARLDNVIGLSSQIENQPNLVGMVADADLFEEPMADVDRWPAKGRGRMRDIDHQAAFVDPDGLMRQHALAVDDHAEALGLLAHLDRGDRGRHRRNVGRCQTGLRHRHIGVPLQGRCRGGDRERETDGRQGGKNPEHGRGMSYVCHSRPSFGWRSLTYSRSCFLP